MMNMNEKKITKKDNYETLLTLVDAAQSEGMIKEDGEYERLVEFINHEIEQLDKRAASAKKYAKKSTKANDELADAIADYMHSVEGEHTIADIVVALDAMGATQQKIAYRLNKLVEAGAVVKKTTTVKEEKGSRKVNIYTWAPVEE